MSKKRLHAFFFRIASDDVMWRRLCRSFRVIRREVSRVPILGKTSTYSALEHSLLHTDPSVSPLSQIGLRTVKDF